MGAGAACCTCAGAVCDSDAAVFGMVTLLAGFLDSADAVPISASLGNVTESPAATATLVEAAGADGTDTVLACCAFASCCAWASARRPRNFLKSPAERNDEDGCDGAFALELESRLPPRDAPAVARGGTRGFSFILESPLVEEIGLGAGVGAGGAATAGAGAGSKRAGVRG